MTQKEDNVEVYEFIVRNSPVYEKDIVKGTGLPPKRVHDTLQRLYDHNLAAKTKELWFGIAIGTLPKEV